jgi:hypothetical protein
VKGRNEAHIDLDFHHHSSYDTQTKHMHVSNKQLYQIIALVIAGLGFGIIANQIKTNPPTLLNRTTPAPSWREQTVPLTDIEQATMTGNFSQEFQTVLAQEKITPRPNPLFTLDVPASMAGDIIAPTVNITGGPTDGSIITATSVCFPLWVGDNMTPWQQLTTRSKLDDGQWSTWMNTFSYCFNNLGIGAHTVLIQIRDLAGNVSSEVKRVFIIKQ